MDVSALGLPDGVADALAVVDALDAALGRGLARVGPTEQAALDGLSAALSASPLGPTLAEAAPALARGEVLAHHLAAVAAGREALLGAVHDALLAHAAAAAGLQVLEPELSDPPARPAELDPLLDSLRQWLVELAVAGFAQLERATLVPMVEGLHGLQQAPELQRLAALVSGFCFELLDHAPTSAVADPPLRRWVDLWARALLGTYRAPSTPARAPVEGQLHVVGGDLRHHDHLVSLVVHGLLEHGGLRTLVRVPVSAWKVDAVTGAEAWQLLRDQQPELVGALAKPVTLAVTGALDSTGALQLATAAPGAALDPRALDLSGARLPAPAPRDRHPVLLAVPAVLASADASGRRVSPMCELDGVEGPLAGLVRWDGGWSVQPLAGTLKKKLATPPSDAKVKTDVTEVLRERASKLLRES